jgi:hypothetical protein
VKIEIGDSDKYFNDRSATCAECGRMERMAGEGRSDWRVLEADGVPYYFCPREFPRDGSGRAAFAKAYERALKTIDELRRLQCDLNLLAALRRVAMSRSATLRAIAGEAIDENFPRPKIERMAKRALQAGLHVQQADVDAIIAQIQARLLTPNS